MASSSSSSSQSWNHDVFLSFRGTDTRKTFVDHLYSALVQQGIYTYKDDETLPRGEAIGPSLLKAIKESRIAVIVFSENYANSSWCLQELAYIMKCKDKRGQLVMPIFYHMDPSEVRKQEGGYGKALTKHESENKKVETWRKALTDVGNISGWETKHITNGHEAKCIKEIVETISNRLTPAISSDDGDLVGIRDRVQDLKSKMEMESDGVVMVGIWGLGGGGKTTLASSLYNEVSNKFDGCCFLENIREESSKHGLPKFQEKILSLVLKQKQMEVNRVEEGGSLIKSRLCCKKVLIVLDDVDHLDQLKALAGSLDWFGEGSRIIITTRDEHVLRAHKEKIVIYNISLLHDDEAIQLFYKHAAVGHVRTIEDHEMLSKDVVSYAGGLPLALVVLGSLLCDKDMNEWMSALARLKDIPDDDILGKLRISYDGLKSLEKELFLDIACFFRGKDKDEAMVILDACGFHPIIGVKVLIQKALITVSEEGMFEMHDLIQEMGHYIVRGENLKNPELHSRIWQITDVLNMCAMEATRENDWIKALQVGLLFDQKFPPCAPSRPQVGNVKKLPQSLPQVVGNMKKLRWFSWYYYSATSLPREFQPMELCCLQLESSLVEQLWEGNKNLPNLKVLDLSCSTKLVRTPDFDGLPCLERIILTDCTNLKEIHPSIGYHQRLIFVDMEKCTSLEMFPPIIRMKKLETLILSCCYKLCKFPEIQTSMDNLSELSLRSTRIISISSSIGQYCTNLVSLDLRGCEYLESIEGNFHLLKYLKGIYLDGCDQLKNIPTEGLFDVKCCLQVLSLRETSLKIFLQGMVSMKLLGFSTCLRRLNLSDCKLEDGDISSVLFNELSNLQVLDLRWNKFSRLHSSLSRLPCLKYLNLSYCKKLVELPDLPSSIAIFIADGCDLLQIVGDFPTNLKWLWKLSIQVKNISVYNGNRSLLMQSMLQGNAIEDHFISLFFYCPRISTSDFEEGTFTLQLPWNWYNESSGFLIQIIVTSPSHVISIKDAEDETDEDQEWDLQVSDETNEDEEMDLEVSDETDKDDERDLQVSGETEEDDDERDLEVLDETYEDDKRDLELELDENEEDQKWDLEVSDETSGEDDKRDLEVSDENEEWFLEVPDEEREIPVNMCYISFGSLRDTSWLKSYHNTISFSTPEYYDYLKVELVPKRSEVDDSIGSAKGAINSLEFWDGEAKGKKTFNIIHDSESSIEIKCRHDIHLDSFDNN